MEDLHGYGRPRSRLRIHAVSNGAGPQPARTRDGARQIWQISGSADSSNFVGRSGPVCMATPTGFEVARTANIIAHLQR